MSPNPATFNI